MQNNPNISPLEAAVGNYNSTQMRIPDKYGISPFKNEGDLSDRVAGNLRYQAEKTGVKSLYGDGFKKIIDEITAKYFKIYQTDIVPLEDKYRKFQYQGLKQIGRHLLSIGKLALGVGALVGLAPAATFLPLVGLGAASFLLGTPKGPNDEGKWGNYLRDTWNGVRQGVYAANNLLPFGGPLFFEVPFSIYEMASNYFGYKNRKKDIRELKVGVERARKAMIYSIGQEATTEYHKRSGLEDKLAA